MSESFLHGIEVVEIQDGQRPVSTVRSSVIGLVGTAPDAESAVAATLVTGSAATDNALRWTAVTPGRGGNDIEIDLRNPRTPDAQLSVSVSRTRISVHLATDAQSAVTTTAADLIAALGAHTQAAALVSVASDGNSADTGVVQGLTTITRLAGGLNEALPLNTPVLITSRNDITQSIAASTATPWAERNRFGTTGTIPSAMDGIWDQAPSWVVVVRVEEGADAAETLTNLIGDRVLGTGVHALAGAESVAHVTPRLLVAPGYTHEAALVSEMIGIAERLRAVIIADGPNTTDAEAITYRSEFRSDRVYLVDPQVTYWDSAVNGESHQPASPRVAGVVAKSDQERGFWWSPSNRAINGIIGTARFVDFRFGAEGGRANTLNEHEVTTIIRPDGSAGLTAGYRLWGNRTCSADPRWAFLSVRRTADMIYESLMQAHLWAVDRNITRTYLEDVRDQVNDYLRHLRAVGAIIDGECWVDPNLNTPDQISQGKVYFDFDFTPPYPAEHITFRSHMTDRYLADIVPAAA